jgi:hypothetical protein
MDIHLGVYLCCDGSIKPPGRRKKAGYFFFIIFTTQHLSPSSFIAIEQPTNGKCVVVFWQRVNRQVTWRCAIPDTQVSEINRPRITTRKKNGGKTFSFLLLVSFFFS